MSKNMDNRRKFLGLMLGLNLGAAFTAMPAISLAQNSAPKLRRPRNRAAGETPSRLPVPRFVSLKGRRVRGRAGPNNAYREVIMYTMAGLPVRVIAETEDWRRIEDPYGRRVWVAKHLLSARRTAIISAGTGGFAIMRANPRTDGRALAQCQTGVIVELDRHQDRPGWRRVKLGHRRGWIDASQLWGA